ncbi:MAG: hypothetical protein CL844_02015 [Crocinitomicaceae bacterium]|nr:hypothetical protein [Crocinitomicaceae bacterium]|tara:strand:- start:11703 stop:12827 length:1125 start_codon:yes stop_codon:yes gene_type:complete
MVEKIYTNITIHAILLLFVSLFSKEIYSQEDENDYAAIRTVVIDAGHGGKDPGCHGSFSQEKEVCLSMALMLGRIIKDNYPNINVIYTRDTDVFIELDERAKIANRNKADLFICIHANAASPKAFGTETYVLGLHRTESQEKVAKRENAIIHLEDDGGAKYNDFDLSPDAIIARQIQLSVFLDQSINFASKLQRAFKDIGRFDRGVKQAGFLVLYKTTMPSVLIETGFLTNPNEEKFLSSEKTQRKMAQAMFSAFRKYKNELEGVEELIDDININEKNIVHENNSENDIIFRVQIETSQTKISLKSKRFKDFSIYEYKQNGIFKYTVGEFINNIKAAREYKNEMIEKGFQHSFVVAFLGEDRINLQKAIKLAEK